MLGRALIASVHAAAPRARALAPGGGRGLAGDVVGRARLLLNLIRGARGGRESDGGGRARREARRSGTLALLAFAFLRFTFMPKIAERINDDEVSAGIMLGGVSISVGLLNAACMTY